MAVSTKHLTEVANKFYHSVFPKSAAHYSYNALSNGATALFRLSVSNVLPSLKLVGATLKGVWASSKILYGHFTQPEEQTALEKEVNAQYQALAFQQITEAKTEGLSASYEVAANTKLAAYHTALGLKEVASIATIATIETASYILPPISDLAWQSANSLTTLGAKKMSNLYLPGFKNLSAKVNPSEIELASFRVRHTL